MNKKIWALVVDKYKDETTIREVVVNTITCLLLTVAVIIGIIIIRALLF